MGVCTAGNAASAEDTLGGIADERRSQLVQGGRGFSALIRAFAGACQLGDMQQFTVAVLFALLALRRRASIAFGSEMRISIPSETG